jgi:transcriptional regulator with XRE-family HTH domain
MEFSSQALGWVIRSLREQSTPRLTQAELGKRAGYRAGAGVTISRIESGQMRPRPDKLDRIASALGSTTPQLEREAARRTREQLGTRAELPLKQRLAQLDEVIERRTTSVTELAEAFNVAHDRARDEFFLKFIDDARQVDGAPTPPEPDGLTDSDASGPGAAAEYRLHLTSSGIAKALGDLGGAPTSAAGGAAAYEDFAAAALLDTASAAAAFSRLPGVANAILGILRSGALAARGGGVTARTMLLAGMVAAPAAALTVRGYVRLAQRNKQKEAELREKVDRAEAEIAATERGFQALTNALSRATGILEYIAVHAAHAEQRWSADLQARPVPWTALSPEQQRDYQKFITIAGCQMSVADVDPSAYLAVRDAALKELIDSTDELLERADRTVRTLV